MEALKKIEGNISYAGDKRKHAQNILSSLDEIHVPGPNYRNFERFRNEEQFNELFDIEAPSLSELEMHELFGLGKIDFVHIDNCYIEPAAVETAHGVLVCLPYNYKYSDWRKVYDSLVG